jgi:hypothetical protein
VGEEVLAELQDIADMLQLPEDMDDSWDAIAAAATPAVTAAGLCAATAAQFDFAGEELWTGGVKTELEWMESLIRL